MTTIFDLKKDPKAFLNKFTLNEHHIAQGTELPATGYARLEMAKNGEYLLKFSAEAVNGATSAYFLGYKPVSVQKNNPAYVDIPKNAMQGDLLFTGSLSGCSIVVTDLDDATYRVFHDSRENSSILHDRVVMAIDFSDYKVIDLPTGSVTGLGAPFMFFDDGKWNIAFQPQEFVNHGSSLKATGGMKIIEPGSYDRELKLLTMRNEWFELDRRIISTANSFGIESGNPEFDPYSMRNAIDHWKELLGKIKVKIDEKTNEYNAKIQDLESRKVGADKATREKIDSNIAAYRKIIGSYNSEHFELTRNIRFVENTWDAIEEKNREGANADAPPLGDKLLDERTRNRYLVVKEQWKAHPNKGQADEFTAGREEFKTTQTTGIDGFDLSMSPLDMKRLFMDDPKLTARQRGALSALIDQADLDANLHASLEQSVKARDLFRAAGAVNERMVAQGFVVDLVHANRGVCQALSRAMAVALAETQSMNAFVDHLYVAAANPQSGDAKIMWEAINENGALYKLPEGMSVPYQDPFSVKQVVELLKSADGNMFCELNTNGHSMMVGVTVADGKRTYTFYDPNFGVFDFKSSADFRNGLEKFFAMEKLRAAYWNDNRHPHILPEGKFELRKIDTEKLASFTLDRVGAGDAFTVKDLVTQPAFKPLSVEELVPALVKIEESVHDPKQPQSGRDQLSALHQQLGDQLRTELWQKDAPTAAHRTAVEQYALQTIQDQHLLQLWNDAAGALVAAQPHGKSLLPTLDVRPAGAGWEVRCVDRASGTSHWLASDDGIFEEVRKRSDTLTEAFGKGFTLDADGTVHVRPGVPETEAAHSLNAAFMLQTLMDVNPKNGGLNALGDALKVQVYAQLVQNGIGMLDDAAKVVALVNTALGGELNLVAKASQVLGTLGSAAGVVLDGVNLGAIITELVQTTDPAARTAVETKLGLAVISTGVNVAALAAGIAGASTVAGVLGIVATPLAGLSIGISALVDAYGQLSAGFDQASARFDVILDSIAQPGLRKQNGVWKLDSRAVVQQIDFTTGTLQYGDMRVTATTKGVAHTVIGGIDNYWNAPYQDNDNPLDVYQGLGLQKQQSFDAANADVVLLPGAAGRTFKTEYGQLLGKRGASAAAFRKMREYYGDRFVWNYYAFTDWGIVKMTEKREWTPIEVKLDDKTRSLILPTVTDAAERDQIAYTLRGNGGTCVVALPAAAVNLTIAASTQTAERWVLQVDNVANSPSVDAGTGQIVLHGVNPAVFANMLIAHDRLTLGGQTIRFEGAAPKSLFVQTTLDAVSGTSLGFSIDAANNSKTAFFLLNPMQLQASIKAAGQLVRQASWLATGSLVNVLVDGALGYLDVRTDTLLAVQYDSSANRSELLRWAGRTMSCTLPGKVEIINSTDRLILSGQLDIAGTKAIFTALPGDGSLVLETLELSEGVLGQWLAAVQGQGQTLAVSNVLAWLQQQTSGTHLAASNGLRISGVDSAGRKLAFEADEFGVLQLIGATWSRNGVSFSYGRKENALLVTASGDMADLNLTEQDLNLPGLKASAELLVIGGAATRSIHLPERMAQFSKVFIASAERAEPVQLQLDVPKAGYHWSIDGADLVLIAPGDRTIRLADAVKDGSVTGGKPQVLVQFADSAQLTISDVLSHVLPLEWRDTQIFGLHIGQDAAGKRYFFDPVQKQVTAYRDKLSPEPVRFSLEPLSGAMLRNGELLLVGKSKLVYRQENGQTIVTGRLDQQNEVVQRPGGELTIPANVFFPVEGIRDFFPHPRTGQVCIEGVSGLVYSPRGFDNALIGIRRTNGSILEINTYNPPVPKQVWKAADNSIYYKDLWSGNLFTLTENWGRLDTLPVNGSYGQWEIVESGGSLIWFPGSNNKFATGYQLKAGMLDRTFGYPRSLFDDVQGPPGIMTPQVNRASPAGVMPGSDSVMAHELKLTEAISSMVPRANPGESVSADRTPLTAPRPALTLPL